VHNGVDVERFRPDIASEHGSPTVLSIGNLIPTKGHAVLLEAIAEVLRAFPELRCQIVGIGPEQRKLMELANKLVISRQVHFLGRQTRQAVADLLRRCTLFALPSAYEGLGCVYLEAMASAKATIACMGQGIEDVIKHGENGWLVEPNNSTVLADSLRKLLRDPGLRYRLGANARKTVVQGLTLAHHAVQLGQIYRESLS
jgi:glycosyltransferase involved in cell wall biosynthesis